MIWVAELGSLLTGRPDEHSGHALDRWGRKDHTKKGAGATTSLTNRRRSCPGPGPIGQRTSGRTRQHTRAMRACSPSRRATLGLLVGLTVEARQYDSVRITAPAVSFFDGRTVWAGMVG